MESRVLPDPEVVAVLSAKFVCVKVDADNPGAAEKILGQVKGNTLPFYAYVTPDGKFISGTSGYRDTAVFKSDLDAALKSDLMRVPPDAEKKLAKMAEQAAKDLEAKKIPAVVKAAKDADAIRGTSESKDKVKQLYAQAIEAGQQKIKEAAELCKDAKFDEALALLAATAKDYKGTELEKPAAAATKAAERLRGASKEPAAAKKMYELIIKECKDAPAFVELAEAKLKE